MAKVERGNVILRVDDKDVQRYLLLGYNVIDEDGRVVKSAIPTDLRTLQKAYVDDKARIAELEGIIAQMTAERNAEKAQKQAKTSETKKPTAKKTVK